MNPGTPNPSGQLRYLQAQEASAWVEALCNPSPAQRAAFVAWLKDSPRNVQDFLLMLTIDNALDHIDAKRLLDIQTLCAQVNRQVLPFPTQRKSPERLGAGRSSWRRPAIAAALVAALVGGWALLAQRGADWKDLRTGASEQRSVELQDGSVIQLNARSHATFRFLTQSREVRLLEGEALFRVHHDAGRPFRVYTNDAVIQDVGTQFNVYSRSDGTLISVIEGRVNVTPGVHVDLSATSPRAAGDQPHAAAPAQVASLNVSANEEVQVNHAGAMSVHTVVNVLDAVAWQQRRLVFRRQTLANIVEEFNRYNHQQVRVEGADALARVYSGVFDADDPDSLALVLSREPDLAVEQTAEGFVVRLRASTASSH